MDRARYKHKLFRMATGGHYHTCQAWLAETKTRPEVPTDASPEDLAGV